MFSSVHYRCNVLKVLFGLRQTTLPKRSIRVHPASSSSRRWASRSTGAASRWYEPDPSSSILSRSLTPPPLFRYEIDHISSNPHNTHANLTRPRTISSTPNVPGTTHAHHREPLLRSRWATRIPKTPMTAPINDESTTTRTTLTPSVSLSTRPRAARPTCIPLEPPRSRPCPPRRLRRGRHRGAGPRPDARRTRGSAVRDT